MRERGHKRVPRGRDGGPEGAERLVNEVVGEVRHLTERRLWHRREHGGAVSKCK